MFLSMLGGAEAAGEQGKYSQKCVTASVPQLIGPSHMYTMRQGRNIPRDTEHAHKQIRIDMHVKY